MVGFLKYRLFDENWVEGNDEAAKKTKASYVLFENNSGRTLAASFIW
jgi:hypothetical protein